MVQGFTPKLEDAARYDFFVWSWRKLIIAGIMIASLVFALASRLLSLEIAIKASSTLLLLWTGSMVVAWHSYVKPQLIDSKPSTSSTRAKLSPPSPESADWRSKVVQEDDLIDNRLPLTVVTGYL